MKTLVSTLRTQSTRPGDFYWASEGEFVTSGTYGMCDSYRHAPPGGVSDCGCDRSFTTIETGRGTTTAVVVETDLTREELVGKLAARLRKAFDGSMSEAEAWEVAEEEVDETLGFVSTLAVGRVVRQNAKGMFTH